MRSLFTALLTLTLLGPVCDTGKTMTSAMTISSSSFEHQKPIPSVYTCEGKNQSPHLTWKNLPPKTQSLALIVRDPDAPRGTVIHWVAWNIDPTSKELPVNVSAGAFKQGLNSAQKLGYMGPCPPSGQHRYYFRLYALDKNLTLPEGTTNEEQLLAAMKGHILAEAELMGTYQKTH